MTRKSKWKLKRVWEEPGDDGNEGPTEIVIRSQVIKTRWSDDPTSTRTRSPATSSRRPRR